MENESVKDKPLANSKIERLKVLMRESYIETNFLRKIIPVKKVEKDNKETIFFKLGINEIFDRIWLVDSTGLKAHYHYENIGQDYGRNIALSEINALIKKILDSENSQKASLRKELNKEFFEKLSNDLLYKGFDTILANIYIDFWNMDGFEPAKSEEKGFYYGKICGLKIFSSPSVPKGTTIIFNSKNFAEILEKEPINLKVSEKLDKEKIIGHLPQLRNADFDEKINILVEETLGLKVKNPKSVLILKHI